MPEEDHDPRPQYREIAALFDLHQHEAQAPATCHSIAEPNSFGSSEEKRVPIFKDTRPCTPMLADAENSGMSGEFSLFDGAKQDFASDPHTHRQPVRLFKNVRPYAPTSEKSQNSSIFTSLSPDSGANQNYSSDLYALYGPNSLFKDTRPYVPPSKESEGFPFLFEGLPPPKDINPLDTDDWRQRLRPILLDAYRHLSSRSLDRLDLASKDGYSDTHGAQKFEQRDEGLKAKKPDSTKEWKQGVSMNVSEAYQYLQITDHTFPDQVIALISSYLVKDHPVLVLRALFIIALHRESRELLRAMAQQVDGITEQIPWYITNALKHIDMLGRADGAR